VIWGDAGVRWWQLFTGDALPERWKRRALALEPMTCGPNALNTGEDLIVLEPGGSHAMAWGLALRPAEG
jgi:aldose 1-epimerase